MSISNRISEVCKIKKIKNIDLVNLKCGSTQTVSFVLNNKVNPNSGFLSIFLMNNEDVNARWLLTGKGSMFESEGYIDGGKSGFMNRIYTELLENMKIQIDKLTVFNDGLLNQIVLQSEEIGRLKEQLKHNGHEDR